MMMILDFDYFILERSRMCVLISQWHLVFDFVYLVYTFGVSVLSHSNEAKQSQVKSRSCLHNQHTSCTPNLSPISLHNMGTQPPFHVIFVPCYICTPPPPPPPIIIELIHHVHVGNETNIDQSYP